MNNILYKIFFGGLFPWFTMAITPTPKMKHYHITISWLFFFKITITFSIKTNLNSISNTIF